MSKFNPFDDIDPTETAEWLESIDSVLSQHGPERAHFLLNRVIDFARRSGAYLPYSPNTAYQNTIAPGRQLTRRRVTLQDDACARLVRCEIDRAIEQRLVRYHAAGFDAAAGRNDDIGFRIVDARREFAGGEAAEHHRMYRPDAGAGQHGHGRFRDHRHVNNDAIAFARTVLS